MLVIKIELWPFGQEDKARLLARGVIVNTTMHDDVEKGDYFAEFLTDGTNSRAGEVKGHARLTESVWTLLRKCLDSAKY